MSKLAYLPALLGLIAACGAMAVYGMRSRKPALVAGALVLSIVGSLTVGLVWNVPLSFATTGFAAILAVLGMLMAVEGRVKKRRAIAIQGWVQILAGFAILARFDLGRLVSPSRWSVPLVTALNLPWLALGIVLTALIIRGLVRNSDK